MFSGLSGLKNAVESFAPPHLRTSSIDETRPEGAASPDGAASPGTSSTSWATNPLSGATIPSIAGLSKLPFGVRSASPARSASPRVASPAPSGREQQSGAQRQRLTLEDRLKARLTPGGPTRTPPLPSTNPLSPTLIPLPESPITSPLDIPPSLSRIDSEIEALTLDTKKDSTLDAGVHEAALATPTTEAPIAPRMAKAVSESEATDTEQSLYESAESEPEETPSPDESARDIQDLQTTDWASSLAFTAPDTTPTAPLAEEASHDDQGPSDILSNNEKGMSTPDDVSSSQVKSFGVGVDASEVRPLQTIQSDGNTADISASLAFTSTPDVDTATAPEVTIVSPLPEAKSFSIVEAAAPMEVPIILSDAATGLEAPTVPDAPSIVDVPTVQQVLDSTSAETIRRNSTNESASPILPPLPAPDAGKDVEALRERLKLLETRFADVSTSFKKLQADKMAADKVVQELISLNTVHDAIGLREHLDGAALKVEMSQDEIKRLTGKLTRQEERLQELRDIHHMETKSQTELIDRLRREAEDASTTSKSSNASILKAEEEASKYKKEAERLQADLQKAATVAKEEEEKRTKAISLLKTVRQKLVKTEKERDDALRDADAGRSKVQDELEKERAEKAQVQAEVAKAVAERENALAGMKSHFDREIAGLKDRQQKEVTAIKAQLELEAVTAKASFSKELAAKDARVSSLEKSVQSLSQEKNHLFEQLQMRQAEYESSQSQMESMQGQTAELNYQLREATERVELLTEELGEVRREQHARSSGTSHSADDAARILALTEARYEAKLGELQNRVHASERERNDGESAWSRKLDEKTRELDALRRQMDASTDIEFRHQAALAQIHEENERLRQEMLSHRSDVTNLRLVADQAAEAESTATAEAEQANAKATALEQQLEELRNREAQLKTSNKTMREELRKVQSSAALFERQRAPGVGYWSAARTSSSAEANGRTSMSSTDLSSPASPKSDGTPLPNEEEVNLEYLRNVILQFLENEKMRPNLVRVLSAVLRFTPQETRRLVAKV